MTEEPFYRSHWRTIDPDRMSAYRKGFRWDETAEDLYRPAGIAPGHVVADFGCGPGHVAVELARRVGPGGHVHAVDINPAFLDIASVSAAAAGVSDRLTCHCGNGGALPLDDGTLDRITARNTLMYVDDPVATLTDFQRVLRTGGVAHAIDGDWFMMVAEPIEHDHWRAFVRAASFACRNADMGRKLVSSFRQAGFRDVAMSIHASADTDGRLLGMIRNMATYARHSGSISQNDTESVVDRMERALADGTYLVVSPQFVATAPKPAAP